MKKYIIINIYKNMDDLEKELLELEQQEKLSQKGGKKIVIDKKKI